MKNVDLLLTNRKDLSIIYLVIRNFVRGIGMQPPHHGSFSPKTDEQLVLSACAGDEISLNELLLRFSPLVKKISSRFHTVALENDDLLQEGMLGLISAVYTFSSEKNTSFSAYAYICISNRISTAVRAEFSLKHLPLNTYVSLDDEALASGMSPEEQLIAEEAAKGLIAFLESNLSDLELSALRLFLTGCDYATIADKLSVTPKAVDNALQRARGKLKSGKNNVHYG